MPEIGEIQRGSVVGKTDDRHKWIWQLCSQCGAGRWVRLLNGQPKHGRCHNCNFRGQYKNGVGPANSNWKGDNTTAKNARVRAQRWFPMKPCEVCGAPGNHHHRDENPFNNVESNIVYLCNSHHRKLHCQTQARASDGKFTARRN